MSTYNKFLLALIALAYLVSPVDLIPDLLLPFIGWIDDGLLLGLILYYLKFNRLPGFFNWKSNARDSDHSHDTADDRANQEQPRARNQQQASDSLKKPHEILGIRKNATRQEIQAAFRAAAKQYHPDRVAGLGKEFQDLANRRFIEIKDAYTRMMENK